MEILKTIKKDNVQIQFVALEGSKFRIRYEQKYSASHPYDKECFNAEVLTAENGWVVIADEEDIVFERAKFEDSLHDHDENAAEFFTAMRYHLQMLYR